MPDHIHVFVGERNLARYRLENWVAAWKSFVALRWPEAKESQFGSGAFGIAKSAAVTRTIRSGCMCETIPSVMDMVQNPEDWPFQGAMNTLS